ncbi:MAG: ATP-binding protein [Hydrogenoanaerobacterium sp.]
MKKQIIIRCIFLCVAVVLISGAGAAVILQHNKEQNIINGMKDVLTAIALQEKSESEDYTAFVRSYNSPSFKYRITVLSKTGEVLGDSFFDKAAMENHADRPEVKQAMAAGTGYEKRSSETFGKPMIYVAMRKGNIIYRIAAPVDSINATIMDLFPAFLAGLVLALLIAPFLAASTAKTLTKPLKDVAAALKNLDSDSLDGDSYDVQLPVPSEEELQPIIATINTLTQHISQTVRELSDQKEKTEYLIGSMENGLILVGGDLKVLQINSAAEHFLGENREVVGKKLLLLTRRKKLVDAVKNAIENGASSLFDVDGGEQMNGILSVQVTPVHSEWLERGKRSGAVVLLTDVTVLRQNENMRSEFVANASHELKTPITSIGGFAELLAGGVVKEPEKVQEYLVRIKSETQRMALLIDDILRLSCIENGADDEKAYEPVHLKEQIDELAENLQPQLTAHDIRLEVQAEDIVINAVPDEMETLMQNLLDNAVKYNREGGTVKVTLERCGGALRFVVADTGIGIPYEDRARIFERFYRVDKGRSRKVGGTGLGLAIVKHVVSKYGGELILQSDEGKGTTISVTLPISN